jgi:flagellar hook-associated protein 2
MATASSLGVGSGLDLNSLLTKLMASERLPVTAIETKISAASTKISFYGKLKIALATLQTAANTLATPSKLAAFTATTSDSTIATATTASNASPGTYAVNVTQLAVAQKSFSTLFASTTSFGQGSLDFTVNGTPQSISLTDKASYTINDIRAKINTANIGVTAAVISGTGGERLVLSGTSEGSAGAFSLAVTSGDANLNLLVPFDTDVALASTTAQNAIFSVDGVASTSSTNTLSTAVNGLTLTLVKAGTASITVKSDTSKVVASAQAFVDGYNAVNTLIKANSGYDKTTKTAGPLNAESTIRTIQGLLNTARTTTPTALSSATYKTLAELGISASTTADGSLSFDSSKLTSAIGISFADVQTTLGAFGTAFYNTLTNVLATSGTNATTGAIQNRLNGLNSSISLYNDNKAALELRIAAVEKRYRAQFTALDRTVGSMQTTSSYLSQQLARLG